MDLSRRNWLLVAAGLALRSFLPLRALARETEIKSRSLIQHWDSPNFLETPLQELGKSWITPNRLFFVLNRRPPEISAEEMQRWEISVGGQVDHPFRIQVADLLNSAKFKQVQFPAYLQCCGNGRRFFKPELDDLPWGSGAIGNAVWSGVPLNEILRAARLKPGAQHIFFAGKDAFSDRARPYIKSIPITKALDSFTLLATHMNDTPLPVIHGGPVRMIVPGWGGTYSIKWLTDINAQEQPWNGFWMAQAYRIPLHPMAPGTSIPLSETRPFTEFSVNSIITSPADNDIVRRGPAQVIGFAWTGEAEVVAVEVSTDGGLSWRPAFLKPENIRSAKYAWKQWTFSWSPKVGSHVLMARARDTNGQSQPLRSDNWNPGGYGWNATQAIRVTAK